METLRAGLDLRLAGPPRPIGPIDIYRKYGHQVRALLEDQQCAIASRSADMKQSGLECLTELDRYLNEIESDKFVSEEGDVRTLSSAICVETLATLDVLDGNKEDRKERAKESLYR